MRNWKRRRGFTLVELLTVIAIIGLIAGMLVPAVMFAFRTAQARAMAMEVTTIAGAIDKYKEKYGDYPPDGSSATAMTRHLRKVFPQIAASELALLTAGSNASNGLSGAVMDPPEALVFFLGGFSDDPVHPFTGSGGPFSATPSGSRTPIQYNVVRNAPLYDFKQGQLSLEVIPDPDSGAPITVSIDETDFGFATPPGFPGDVIPVYRPSGRLAPFVYFNSNTYVVGSEFNSYQAAPVGAARPYKSDDVNTSTTGDPYRYAEDRTYQVICGGLDDHYGGYPTANASVEPLFFRFPSGSSLFVSSGNSPTDGYMLPDGTNLQRDNCTNFSEGTLSDSMP